MTGHRIAPKFFPVVLSVCLGALWAAPLTAAPGAVQVRAIRVSETGGDTAVVIAASARPTFTTWKLEQPDRVVVDVSGARLGDVDVPVDAGTYAVGMVSANVSEDEASGPHTRIVLTLRQASDYQVEAHGPDIVVRVQPRVRPIPASDNSATRAEADQLKKQLELARQEADKARAAASAAAVAAERHRSEVARLEAQTRGEAGASETQKAEAERLRTQLAEARQEAEKARIAASATAAEAERRRETLARSEVEAKKAQREAEQARQRAEAAERKTRETLARSEAEAKKAQREAEQARQRAEAAERKTRETLARSETEERKAQREAEEARQRAEAAEHKTREALARSEAEAKKAQSEAEEARRRAEAAERETREVQAREAERNRALAEAVRQIETRDQALQANARSQEDQRRRLSEAQRLVQTREAQLAAKDKARAAEEEQRLAQARAARAKLEEERTRLEAERAELLQTRDALAAEVARLKAAAQTGERAVLAPAPARATSAPIARTEAPRTEIMRVVSEPAEAKGAHPRSITLRVPSQIQRVAFVDEPTRSSVIIELNEPSDFSVERAAGKRLSLRFEHAELPQSLERSLDATEYLGPVRLISTYRDPRQRGAVRVDVDLAENVPSRVRREGTRIFWDFQKAPEKSPALPALEFPLPKVELMKAPKVASFSIDVAQVAVVAQTQTLNRKGATDPAGAGIRPTKKRYVGRRIDLDFKGADIHNILRLLSDVGQINIVTSDEVRGEVTIKMRDVPWDQAMDVVLRAKGLGSVREGNLLRVAPLSVLEKELEEEIHRQKAMQEVLPTETRLIGVSYASASSLQEKAKDLLSPRGKISVDERTNNLIVSDVARNLQLVEDLVRNLDTQTAQVVIEARIVEARSTFARQLGIQWGGNAFMDSAHGNSTGLSFPYNIGIGGGADDSNSPLSGLVPSARTGNPQNSSNPNFLVNMPVAAGQGTGSAIGLTLGSVSGAFNLNLRLSANESTGQVRILSSPRITTMDNIHASISQGVSIPVSVVSAMGTQTQFVDAKLDLGVKPHVTNEGTITLDLSVTRNEPDFSNTGARGDPTILKKEAKTTMLVRDGDTAVIGGIYTRNSGLSHAKVPFFADIPVLGWFFRNRKENDDRTEFLVFITPRIVNRARSLGQ